MPASTLAIIASDEYVAPLTASALTRAASSADLPVHRSSSGKTRSKNDGVSALGSGLIPVIMPSLT